MLVINPIIQYTVFEQLKNFLVAGRTAKLRASGAKNAVAVLSDPDYFLLGAVSKLVATSSTYPYMYVFFSRALSTLFAHVPLRSLALLRAGCKLVKPTLRGIGLPLTVSRRSSRKRALKACTKALVASSHRAF